MHYISINTAASLSGLSKRTLWRRVADGHLRAISTGSGERTGIALDDATALSRLRLAAEDGELIVAADAGDPDAQCDLALMFLAQDYAESALPWLEAAARQYHAEAMHWLGRCYIAGKGVPADEKLGADWISKTASRGHSTASHMVRYLESSDRPREPAAVEAALDAIERKIVLAVLDETAYSSPR
ncbi:MAG: hypothetical protein ROZ37_01640 [Aromatoleum sp.]|uniref:hypothetical protein n=1 Tax=Aromatoleum sp. TaxID=2307007 RepID=UPI0028960CEB|nr:hypothetical protein [Aromatoleum sp.]MDT3669017.1 hypothetical protein [Aromatoleum sp.]